MLTYIGDHDVEDLASDEKPPQFISPEKEVSLGLENLHFTDELGFGDQLLPESASLQPSPSPPDKAEESTETGLAHLKDEFLGQKYSLVLLPKRHGESTQRLVVNCMVSLISDAF